MKKFQRKVKGFTLIELIVVIAILALLAAIAIPRYNASREKGALTAHNANVRVLVSAGQMYLAEKGPVAVTWSDAASAANYVQEWPKVPSGLKSGGAAVTATGYTVTITDTGQVTVTPAAIPE